MLIWVIAELQGLEHVCQQRANADACARATVPSVSYTAVQCHLLLLARIVSQLITHPHHNATWCRCMGRSSGACITQYLACTTCTTTPFQPDTEYHRYLPTSANLPHVSSTTMALPASSHALFAYRSGTMCKRLEPPGQISQYSQAMQILFQVYVTSVSG